MKNLYPLGKRAVRAALFTLLLVTAGVTKVYAQPQGAINGVFTINENGDQVMFSQGNLQYQASTNTWRFAENQWECVGEDNANISETYDGWIDLFGWGTSGYHDTNDPYNVNYFPWSNSTSTVNNTFNKDGYGPSRNMLFPDLDGRSVYYDWGVYNAISNGGNQSGLWRNLTYGEWSYICYNRNTASGIRCALAKVNNINGMILLPDDWEASYYPLYSVNNTIYEFSENDISSSQWSLLEQHGAVFLPAGGNRSETSISYVGETGGYWSSSAAYLDAYRFRFGTGILNLSYPRCLGQSVRLVYPLQFTIIGTSNPTGGGEVIGSGVYTEGSECTLTAIPRDGFTFIDWVEDGETVSTNTNYSFEVTGFRYVEARFTNPNIITFEDSNVEAVCLSNWDSNNDGLLSYEEAAAVMALGEVFRGNSSIKSFNELHFFTGLTTIGENAFFGCSNLNSIDFPNTVIAIEYAAFAYCGLYSIIIPSWIEEINGAAFPYCRELNQIVVEEENAVYDSRDNCNAIIHTSTNKLVTGCKSTVIPNSVTEIGYSAFRGCRSLTSVIIPDNVTMIDSYAFDACYLDSVTVLSYLPPVLGYNAFYRNSNDIPVFVPCGSVDAYQNAEGWNEFTNYQELNCWTPVDGQYEDNLALTAVIEIEGVEQASDMLELGAFCGEECRGSQRASFFELGQRYVVQIALFGDPGDQITFKLYNHETHEELDLISPFPITYSSGFMGNPIDPYVLNFRIPFTHSRIFNEGWNWWSTYVEQSYIDGLSQLENSLDNSGIMIKSRDEGFVEWYDYNGSTGWYGTLNGIYNEQFYKVRTSEACNAILTGPAAKALDYPITINPGWNWIGFPCRQSLNVADALSDFIPENNDILKGRNGFTTYCSDGTVSMWYGPQLEVLEPGQGYMYYSNSTESKTLVFTENRNGVQVDPTPMNLVCKPMEKDFADNMTIVAKLEMEGSSIRSSDYELAAFVGGECRGSVKLWYVDAVDTYMAFLTVFGTQGEEMQFRLMDGNDYDLAMEKTDFVVDGNSGTIDNPYVLHFRYTDVAEELVVPVTISPNPSNGYFLVEGKDMRLVEVFNTLGQRVFAEEVYGNTLRVNLSHCANGVYMVRVVTSEGVSNHSVVKQ